MSLYEIFQSCGCRLSTDSRKIEGGELFFALQGENFDGNAFAQKALAAGAARAVVSSFVHADASVGDDVGVDLNDERLILVPDTLTALQDLAREHRRRMALPVIALTGTNGKTTTKELIRSVLSRKFRVCATGGNLNNDIGVPLSLLRIDAQTQIAVIEMGANHPDDIEKLVRVVEPDFGLITNVGRAHLLGFGSFEGVKKAKGALYDYLAQSGGKVFLNADDEDLCRMAEGLEDVCAYGAADVTVLEPDAENPYLRFMLGGQVVETQLIGDYNLPNVLAALAVGQYFGIPLAEAAEAVAAFVPENKRSQMVRTEKNVLILDAYNANPSSMAAALDNFKKLGCDKKLALLGDMRELGKESLAEHGKILDKLLRDLPSCEFCLVGQEFTKAVALLEDFPESVRVFDSSADLLECLREEDLRGWTVLIKGSRGIEMEKVLPAL